MRGGSILLLSFIALAVSLSEQQELGGGGGGGGGGDDGGIRQRPRMPDLSKVRAAREARGAVPEDMGETEEKKISEGDGDGDGGGGGGGGGGNVAPIASRAVAALLAKAHDAAEETYVMHGEGKVAASADDDRGHEDAATGERDVTTGENSSEKVGHEGGADDDSGAAAAPEELASQEESDERRSDDAGHETAGSEGDVGDGEGEDADGGEVFGDIARQGDLDAEDERGGDGNVGAGEKESGAEDELSRASAAGGISEDVATLTGERPDDADATGGKEEGGGESGDGEGVKDVEGKGKRADGAYENVKEEEKEEEKEEVKEEEKEKDDGIVVDVPLRTSSEEGAGPRACPVNNPATNPPSPSSPSQIARPQPTPPLLKGPPSSLRETPSAPAQHETKRRNVKRGPGMLASSLNLKEGAKPRPAGNRRNLGTSSWSPLPPYEVPRKERMGGGGEAVARPRPELGISGILRVQVASCVSYGIYYLMFESCAKWMAASTRGRVKATGPIMAAFAMSVPVHHVLLRIATRGVDILDGPSSLLSLLSGFGRTVSMCLFGLAASPVIEHMVKMAGVDRVVEDATLLTWVASGVWAAYHTLIVSRSL